MAGAAAAVAVGIVVGFASATGPALVRADAVRAIGAIRAATAGDRAAAGTRALGGFIVAMVLVLVLPALVCGSFGLLVAVLLLLPSTNGVVRPVAAIVTRVARAGPSESDATLFLAGATVAFALGAVVSDWAVQAALLVFGIVAVVLLRRAKTTGAAVILVVLAASLLSDHPPSAGAAPSPTTITPSATASVKVPGGQTTFVPVRVAVTYGMQVTITAKGRVKFLAEDGQTSVGPDGGPANYAGCDGPGFCGGLIGRMGEKGALFRVGASHAFVADGAGPLLLAVNDFDPSDNTGSFDVTVRVAPSPASVTPGATTSPAGSPTSSSSSSSSSSRTGASLVGALFAAIGAVFGRGLGLATATRAARAFEDVAP